MNSVTSVSSKSATWSITFGIAAVILLLIGYFTFSWMPFFGWAAGLVALFFGIAALRKPVNLLGNNKTMATIGTAIGIISVLYLVFSIVASLVQA
jgi:hypothetical protein